ncbi:MAG: T9SS type A sorting domain-containing protein [Bacteroidales bacterium]|jgi:hypothetical protein|nr:T9SS type A sorting domain-containing protein [Bacteroidales bacterium]
MMKKLFLFLVTAAILSAGGVQSQQRVPVGDGLSVTTAQERFIKNASAAKKESAKHNGFALKSASKASYSEGMDTIQPLAFLDPTYSKSNYSAGGNYWYFRHPNKDANPLDLNLLVWGSFITGTMAPFVLSGPEIGQKFSTSLYESGTSSPYVDLLGIDMRDYMVVGAVIAYSRYTSTAWSSWGFDKDNIPSMPFRMKLYGPDGAVEKQEFYRQIIQPAINEDPNSARRKELAKITSTYPKSRHLYSGITDTLWAEFRNLKSGDPDYNKDFSSYLYFGFTGGLFDRPASAGSDFCITLEMPVHKDSKNKFDSVWNFSLCVPKTEGASTEVDEYDINGIILSINIENNRLDLSQTTNKTGKSWLLPAGNPQITTDPTDSILFFPASSWSWFSPDWPAGGYKNDAEADAGANNMKPAIRTAVAIFPIIALGTSAEKANPSLLRVSVSPVPATDNIDIVCVDKMEKVEILNLAGKVLHKQAVNDQIASVDVKGLPSGMYLVRVSTKDNSITKKVIVK